MIFLKLIAFYAKLNKILDINYDKIKYHIYSQNKNRNYKLMLMERLKEE